MATFQNYTIIGNLGRDPRTGNSQKDKPYTSFSVAVDPAFGDGTVWVNVMAYNQLAKNCAQYLRKGAKVHVSGELLPPKIYQPQNGEPSVDLTLVARQVTFLSSRQEGDLGVDDGSDDIPF